MPNCNCHPPFPRPEPFSPLPHPGRTPDWGKWVRDRLAEKGALLAFPTRTAFPPAGSAPNLYLAEDTGVVYRWGGEGYAVLVDPSPDVEVYPGRSTFPDTGRTGVVYIDASANLLYRWDGTGYVLLTSDLSGVESRLADVESKVPAQATAQNQLADKAFVNSSIATNTAFYISDNGRPFQSLADLESYEGALTNNDYAFVVGRDAAGNTTYTRYKWNEATEAWGEEYVLNNSSFTAEQWAAISSGITSGLVAKLGALPTAEALAQALAGKASTADATLTPVYGGNGNKYSGYKIVPTEYDGEPVKLIQDGNSWYFTWGEFGTESPTNIVFDGTIPVTIQSEHFTATAILNPLTGYTLGSQSDKPLQPKGDYPTKAQMDAGWWSEWTILRNGVNVTAQVKQPTWAGYYWEGMASVVAGDTLASMDGGGIDSTLLSYEAFDTAMNAVPYTATRHRVAAPVPTKPEDIGAATRAANPTAGNLAALDAQGNPTDSGIAKTNAAQLTDLPYSIVTPDGGQLVDHAVNTVTASSGVTLTLPTATTEKVRDMLVRLTMSQPSGAYEVTFSAPSGETITWDSAGSPSGWYVAGTYLIGITEVAAHVFHVSTPDRIRASAITSGEINPARLPTGNPSGKGALRLTNNLNSSWGESSGYAVTPHAVSLVSSRVTALEGRISALEGGGSGECFLAGTMVTLADGSRKPIEDVRATDELMVWDFDEGRKSTAFPAWVKSPQVRYYWWRNTFENGIVLNTTGNVAGHRFFCVDEGKFLYNIDCVGKLVMMEDGTTSRLASAEYIESRCEYYNIITARHFNIYTEGVLTSTGLNNLYPIDTGAMKFIKDDREPRPASEFPLVPERWYTAMRFSEQYESVEALTNDFRWRWEMSREYRASLPRWALIKGGKREARCLVEGHAWREAIDLYVGQMRPLGMYPLETVGTKPEVPEGKHLAHRYVFDGEKIVKSYAIVDGPDDTWLTDIPRRWSRLSIKTALADAHMLSSARQLLSAFEIKPDYPAWEALTDCDYIEEGYGGDEQWNALLDGAAQAFGKTRAEIDAFLDTIPTEGG